METYIRSGEDEKSPAQKLQRERTYEAAKVLRAAGFDCVVQEYFTGSSTRADTAGIVLELEP